MRCHGRRIFIGRLYPRLFVRTCIWNVSRGAVHWSWQTRTALLAWNVLSFYFRSSRSMPLTLFSLRTKRCSWSLHLTIGRTKSVADCGNFWRRRLAFSSGRALCGLPWPPVHCACVPQLFEQLINTTLCQVSQEIRQSTSSLCTLSNTNFESQSCPRRLISCWLLSNTAVTGLRWRISGATNWSPK